MTTSVLPATKRGPARVARASDLVLEIGIAAFAAWTLIYHAAILVGAGTSAAAIALGVVLVAAAGWALRPRFKGGEPPDRVAPAAPADARPGAPPRLRPRRALGPRLRGVLGPRLQSVPAPRLRGVLGPRLQSVPAPRLRRALGRRLGAVLGVNLVAAAMAAALFVVRPAPWPVVWLLCVVAAMAALAFTALRRDGAELPDGDGPSWPEVAVVAAWALGLAVFALLLIDPNSDDAYYVRLSSWAAAHGRFPVGDVIFSDERFPALFWPPLPSFEALLGTLARVTSLSAPGLVYLVVPAVGSVASVLALWRLLRTWRTPMPALAVSVTMLFLLFDGGEQRTFGEYFVNRMWQGKVLFLCILVPLLLALLHEHADRPSRRGTTMLALAGVASVGLTTTAIFVVPVVVAGAVLGQLGRRARVHLGLLAPAAYPLAAGAVTLAMGGRSAEAYTRTDLRAGELGHYALGWGVPAVVAVVAVLVGPSVIRRRSAAPMVAATVLVAGCLFAPAVPAHIFDLTGLGRVLWRLMWAVPAAALVGALVTGLASKARSRVAAVGIPVAVAATLVLGGRPVWLGVPDAPEKPEIAAPPTWKLPAWLLNRSRRVLAVARPGDVILASDVLSVPLTALSGDVTTVSPRLLYTRAMRKVPGAHARERLLLRDFVAGGLNAVPGASSRDRAAEVRAALRTVGVDIACIRRSSENERALLARAGYVERVAQDATTWCFRARAGPRS